MAKAVALARRANLGAGWALASLVAASAPLAAQSSQSLRGVVTDAESGLPVAGADILIRDTPLRATTGADGAFAIPSPPGDDYVLVVIAQGFDAAELPLAEAEAELDIRLRRRVVSVPGITVTASRSTAEAEATPVSVAVMTGDELSRRDITTLDEALPFAQGVLFNAGQVDIRGATGLARGVGSRVLMLIDGHRALSGVGSSVDFGGLPVLDVEQVEVVKGPSSMLWGTNALGGVVNVITKRPPAQPETIMQGYVGLYDPPAHQAFTDERLGREGLALQHSRRLGDVGATVYAAREGSDGFRQNGGHERWRVRMKTMFPVESANPWELFVNWSRKDEEEFYTWLSPDRPLEVEPQYLGNWVRTDDLVAGITANPVATPRQRLQVRPHVYHARSQNFFHDNEDFHRSTRVGADAQWSLFPSRAHSVTIGGAASTTGTAANFLDPAPEVTDWAVFAQDEFYLSQRLRASLGLRLDHHASTSAERDLTLNPKFALVARAAGRISVRASVGRGYRAPSVSEQYTSTTVFGFRVVPNLELRGETALAREVGATASLGERVWLDAGFFWSDYDGLIEVAAAPNQILTFQFQNVARARVRGVDAGARVSAIPERLDVIANYTFLDAEDLDREKPLAYRSKHNLAASLEWMGLAAVDFRHRSRVRDVLVYPLDERGSITLVDLRGKVTLLGTEVQAKVENLFQVSYVDVQERSPGATRSFRLTVAPRF